MTWKNNHWVKFLEGYCKGKTQIQDEYVRKVAKRLNIGEPLDIKFPWQQEILSKFQSKENHNLIILTGTAGDGKTKLCRDIVQALDGENFDEAIWNETSYFSTDERTVVKDFSELKEEKSDLIRELISILDSKFVPKPILVAVNDGILVEELESFIQASNDEVERTTARLLKEIIEDKINLGFSKCDGQEMVNLINLSKLNAKENMELIFDSILSHPGWNQCEGCNGKENKTCAIFNKYNLLSTEPHIRENLSNIILLLQLNNEHFTIRELLNLATNTLLASTPKSRALRVSDDIEVGASTLNCKAMSKVEHPRVFNSESSIEVGFWGLNLGSHKMLYNRPFSELNKLGFGELSTNYWDTLLRHQEKRGFEIPLDINSNLLVAGRVDGADATNDLWDALMRRSRMQLYCYQKNDKNAYQLQRFSYFGSYIENVYDPLRSSNRAADINTIAMIILSLNRVFHGRYVSEDSGRDRLFIPEKGQGSIAPISIFHGEDIRERDIFIESIKSDMSLPGARIEPVLTLEIDRDKEVRLSMTVELFEYLSRVSRGAPPNTSDPRLYKKLLILRSKLSNLIRKNRRTETYSIQSGEFKPVILEVKNG
ncbi:hypothetical protein J4N42_05345 [Vibrio sp. SCSIO 43135]|uniref:hypothetical protein n=1 Tax=Vibrio sp. SCSIO 43135 TaxID=2819096 RepID=UPI002075E7DD|nr:hypothetical protein [Vibrio sp. SCSIO 43135]USD42147.1 hypothetical protein J4N42_05345 [Vibrio sp. SCSIO 43135]